MKKLTFILIAILALITLNLAMIPEVSEPSPPGIVQIAASENIDQPAAITVENNDAVLMNYAALPDKKADRVQTLRLKNRDFGAINLQNFKADRESFDLPPELTVNHGNKNHPAFIDWGFLGYSTRIRDQG